MSQQTIQRQRLLMEVFLLSCLFLHFCVFFLFLQSIYLSMPKLETFLLLKTHRLSLQENIFILYCLFSSVLASLSVGIVSWSGLPDSLSSVAQSMGDVPISNHHPVLFTLLVKLFVHDLPTDTINHGVFLFSIFQTLITASAISYSLCWLLKRNKHFSGTH